MQVEKSEKFVKAEDIGAAKGVTFTIIEEPIEVIGNYGKKIECRVTMQKGDEKAKAKWSINNTSKDVLIDAFGADTTEWIGKKIEVHTESVNGKLSIFVNREQF